ncbi:hypothetical protein ARC20_08675 [Stenotrophomonas panacihumi]|uniref:Uncharacterized protein n=1 Tax=Stenotrophomonas panacihumi TaxID=676599 RepID=A0A0R0AP73_9GAMM|nr:hypothetical protein ARC20_08675 [Stenotrophomonas panacihumi]PTN56487.1 hypothetical protein C9J98_00495 [Stenotrophomonas panacihumi]
MLSVQRALLGEVHPQLWRVSIEGDSDQRRVHIRFEYEGAPTPDALECGSIVATEVLANLPGSWDLLDEYVQRNPDNPLPPLAHLAFQAGCV